MKKGSGVSQKYKIVIWAVRIWFIILLFCILGYLFTVPKTYIGMEGLKQIRRHEVLFCVALFMGRISSWLVFLVSLWGLTYLKEKSKSRRIITYILSFLFIFILGLSHLSRNVDNRYLGKYSEFSDHIEFIGDLNDDINDKEVDYIENAEILRFLSRKHSCTLHLEDNKKFRIMYGEAETLKKIIENNPNVRFNINYFINSGFIESIIPIECEINNSIEEETVPITLTPTLDESGILKKDTTYFIERPEIDDYEDLNEGLYWYVTKNGDFFEVNNATLKSKTNFPIFYKRGEYEVTLVIDYNEETGEYTPISNTITFVVE